MLACRRVADYRDEQATRYILDARPAVVVGLASAAERVAGFRARMAERQRVAAAAADDTTREPETSWLHELIGTDPSVFANAPEEGWVTFAR